MTRKKAPAEGIKIAATHNKARSNATPGLWRGLLEWARDGRLLGFLLTLGGCLVLGYLFFHPQFRVAEVLIEGNLVLPSDEARQSSAAMGQNIFLLDTLAINQRLIEIPYVQRVQIERLPPNRVLLRIWERFPPVSWWDMQSPERYLVASDGLVLGPEPPEMTDLIYIIDLSNTPVVPGDYVDLEAVHTAQQVFSRLYDDMHISLLPFHYHSGRGITAVSAHGWEACFGNSEHLESKVRNLAALLSSEIEFQWVDLRLLDRMIYR